MISIETICQVTENMVYIHARLYVVGWKSSLSCLPYHSWQNYVTFFSSTRSTYVHPLHYIFSSCHASSSFFVICVLYTPTQIYKWKCRRGKTISCFFSLLLFYKHVKWNRVRGWKWRAKWQVQEKCYRTKCMVQPSNKPVQGTWKEKKTRQRKAYRL